MDRRGGPDWWAARRARLSQLWWSAAWWCGPALDARPRTPPVAVPGRRRSRATRFARLTQEQRQAVAERMRKYWPPVVRKRRRRRDRENDTVVRRRSVLSRWLCPGSMPCAEADPQRPHRTRETKKHRKPLPVAVPPSYCSRAIRGLRVRRGTTRRGDDQPGYAAPQGVVARMGCIRRRPGPGRREPCPATSRPFASGPSSDFLSSWTRLRGPAWP